MEEIELILVLILAGFYAYSLFQRRLSTTIFSLPLVMMLFGLISWLPLDQHLNPENESSLKRIIAEITLVLILFSDASNIQLATFKKIWRYPVRLLLLGMPMSIGLGAALSFGLFPELGIIMAVLISSVLAPTDAALAQPVVTNDDLEPNLRETLNVESGLNDGLAVPFVFGSAALLAGETLQNPVLTALSQILIAPVIGGAVGFLTARLLDKAAEHKFTGQTSRAVVFIITPFLAYLASELLGGNGFIAAFVGGFVFGNTVKQPIEEISSFMESEGQILKMASFFVFGALILPDAFEFFTWKALLLAMLFLTVVRIVPVYISLLGTRLDPLDRLFIGWFGPRGLASILYIFLVTETYEIPNFDAFYTIVALTVFLSIILHGVTAMPFVRQAVKRREKMRTQTKTTPQ